MPDLPAGTVTFLFTDVEGSTVLWERDRAAMRAAVERQLLILHSIVAAHRGVLYKTIGDGAQAAFATAEDGVRAAFDAQRALLAETWAEAPGPVRVRMVLHAGEAAPDAQGDYLAAALNRVARVLATGYGGQILLTQAAQQLTRGALPANVTLRDLGEHRLRDLLEPERIYQLVHPELRSDFPPLASLEARSHNLPRQPTPFLGREREVGEISALLQRDDTQLLTLTGPGGSGKTRLALQAAAEVLDAFPDGVYFVPLAALADPALVPAAIATAVGVLDEGGHSLLERLTAFLAGKQVLLLIDNWEHLLEAAPVLADLLRASPHLTVLATSRAPLRLQAEREYPVPPLALPRRQPPPTPEHLSQYEAVQLFIARAQAVKPDFTVDNSNAPAVAEICHRLDGLPLAIELAAARLRLLSPQALLARLEQRLPLLTGGARDAPARQQTLRQTIAWSHDLLSPEEQVLFRRLAVSTGGFTFEAAEEVANPEGDLDVLAGVSALVDHSLVQQAEDVGGEPRFMMLETIREFGLERLAENGEEEVVRGRHAAYFRALGERGGTVLLNFDSDEDAWVARLAADRHNLRAALAWNLAHGGEGLRLAERLWIFWYYRSDLSEGRRWLEAALAADAAQGHPAPLAVRGEALFGCGVLAQVQGQAEEAAALFAESLALSQATDDAMGVASARSMLGGVLVSQARYAEADVLFAGALDQLRALGNDYWLGHALFHLGLVAYAGGDRDLARTRCAEAVALYAKAGMNRFGIDPLGYLGLIACADGDYGRGSAIFGDVLARLRARGGPSDLSIALAGVATLAAARGEGERAARLFGAADARREAAGGPFPMPARDTFARAAAEVQARLGDAAWAAAYAGGRTLGTEAAFAVADAALTVAADAAPASRSSGHP